MARACLRRRASDNRSRGNRSQRGFTAAWPFLAIISFWVLVGVRCAAEAGPKSPGGTLHGPARVSSGKKGNVLKSELVKSQAQIHQVQSHVQTLVQKGLAISEQIHQDEIAESDAAARLNAGQVHLEKIDDSLCQCLDRLGVTRERLERDRSNLKLRLKDVYEQGNVGIIQLLLNAQNIVDFMNRREYSQRLVQRDLNIVRRVRMDEEDVAAESSALEVARSAKAAEVADIEFQAQRLHAAIADRTAILQSTEQEMESARESVAEMEAASASIKAMLSHLKSRSGLVFPGKGIASYHIHWGGRFILPADGPITSPFGYRYHPILHIYKLHTGVDIGAPWGSSVRAAAGGVVIHASWLGAYGNGVIIDHGDGLATLYGHLSQIDVQVGDVVSQGHLIGLVGSTGLSTGPHLHFEVRRDGTPIPPF